jgi:hypothetical protein
MNLSGAKTCGILLGLSLPLQAGYLAWLIGAGGVATLNLALIGLGLGVLLYQRLKSPVSYPTVWILGMLALGNTGMLLGWSATAGWGPLVADGVCFCGCADSPFGEGLVRWGPMHGGMLLASLPMIGLAVPGAIQLPQRARWLLYNSAHFAVCALLMVAGMIGAAFLISGVLLPLPQLQFLFSLLTMNLGMILGMILSCLLFLRLRNLFHV